MTTLIGYARVSATDQDAFLQTDALKKAGCERIFVDKASGAKASRPELDKMLQHLREGDVVVVWRLDRLGRSLKNLIDLVGRLKEQGVGFRSLGESIDTTTANGRLFFNMMGSLAEFERDLISERTKAGLEAARARGRNGSRPKALSENRAKVAQTLYDSQTPVVEIARTLNVGVATVYRYLNVDQSEAS